MRHRKQLQIPVEERGDDHWADIGTRLLACAPATFEQILALAEGYVSLHEPTLEQREEFFARLQRIAGKHGVA